MKDTIIACQFCQKEFLADKREINRGNAKFCSRSCSSKRKKPQSPNTYCSYCGQVFYRNASKKKQGKNGIFFCCRLHKDLAQRIGGIKDIQPSHYGNNSSNYRAIAGRNFPQECSECGYSKIPDILEVHHKNHNRKDNSVSNLCYLCPNCHQEHHFNSKSGRFAALARLEQAIDG